MYSGLGAEFYVALLWACMNAAQQLPTGLCLQVRTLRKSGLGVGGNPVSLTPPFL